MSNIDAMAILAAIGASFGCFIPAVYSDLSKNLSRIYCAFCAVCMLPLFLYVWVKALT